MVFRTKDLYPDIHEFLNFFLLSGGKDNNSNGLSEVCTSTSVETHLTFVVVGS